MATATVQSIVPRPQIEVEVGPWYEPAEPAPIPDDDLVRRYLRVLYRHRWLEFGVLAAVCAVAAAYVSVATPMYEARATLLIEPDSPTVVTFKEVVEQNTSKGGYYETQLGILHSRTLARTTMDRLKLWANPEFARRPHGIIARAAALAGVDISALTASSSPATPAGDTNSQSWPLDKFLENLVLTSRADDRLVDVRFRSRDRQVAKDVANTLAQAYIDDKRELKVRASREASEWLKTQLSEQRSQLEESERALQRYREQNTNIPLSDQQNIATQKLTDLSSMLTRVRTERMEAESQYAQLASIQNDPASFDTLPLIIANPVVQQLKKDLAALQRDQVQLSEKLGDEHPDMVNLNARITRTQQQLRSEVQKITESAHNEASTVAARERSLSAALEAQKREALEVGSQSIRYEALQREAASNRQMFDSLLQRAKETEISTGNTATNVRIVDSAELPRGAASPRTVLIMVLALVLGVPLAVACAVVRDYADDRINSTGEITSRLGVRVLGFSPQMPRRLAAANPEFVSDQTAPLFAEAFRAIRANLILSVPPEDKKSLVVTSTGPGEGKTLVACNLAVSLARAGRRVLLIDADMRRPQVHHSFKMALEPGFAGVLQAHGPLVDAIRPTAVAGLSVVTAGDMPGTPGDLLELPVLEEALTSIRHQFDWIVIDSPPVMAASDAIALAHVAAAVVFVVGAHMASARDARAAVDQLHRTGARILGAVLSRADLDEDTPYSYAKYGSYYRR
jgi:capsular exopolysaccharide synthesis family protein